MRIFWAIIGLSIVVAGQMPKIAPSRASGAGADKGARLAVHAPGEMPQRFKVFRPGETQSCLLVREPGKLPGDAHIDADPKCSAVFNPLAGAAIWQEGAHGSVILKDRAGRRIAELAPGDGLAYQSVEPAFPILSLVALDDQ